MTRDLEEEEVDRQKSIAQLTHGLMEALGKAIASDQPAAVVGCDHHLVHSFFVAQNAAKR